MFRISFKELEEKAYQIRRDLIDLTYQTGSGHLDTSLSLVEVWLALVYSEFFQFDPKNGAWEGRDRVFLSEGHACPLQYLINADLGYYTKKEIFDGNRKPNTPFQGHTKRNLAYGLENSNGSLGIGLWQAYGHALVTDQRVICIAGDGEMQEPASQGLLSVTHYLKPTPNFVLIVNYNKLAQDSEVNIDWLEEAANRHGWFVQLAFGHDFGELHRAFNANPMPNTSPWLIIVYTIKGKGGDPKKEGQLGRHGVPPKNQEEYQAYLNGLEASRRA